jgi:hypothetical protein
MSASPMTLEEALRHEGYTIEPLTIAAFNIAVSTGTIHVSDTQGSKLVWQHSPIDAEPGDDLWLSSLPLFSNDYRPVLLSNILDRYRTRRLAYNTPDEWRLAFRRWGNLNMSIFNQRYISTGVVLPLDDHDETVAATEHALDVESDFPQSIISGSTDYSTNATDRRRADNDHLTGRRVSIMTLLEEQRSLYLNVDLEIIAELDTLFLGILDQGENSPRQYAPPRGLSHPYGRFFDWEW